MTPERKEESMTQVKEWSNPELNRKLAELMGYTIKKLGSEDFAFAPDYCTDPAASLEVQARALDFDCREYIRNLTIRTLGDEAKDIAFDTTLYSVKYLGLKRLLLATPRERAEAAYITLSSKQ